MGGQRHRDDKRRRREDRRRRAARDRPGHEPQTPSIRECLRVIIDAPDPEAVDAFKASSGLLTMAFVCLEIGAQRDSEKAAAKAVHGALWYVAEHARVSGSTSVHLESLFPFLGGRATRALARAIELAQAPARTSPSKLPLADITLAYVPDEETPPGYARVVARHDDRVVFDRVLDPVEAPEIIERIMHGDPELVGKVPLIGVDVSMEDALEHAKQVRERGARRPRTQAATEEDS